jgi:RIO-like serine/threonine protein kinase
VEHWWPFDLLEEMGELLGVGRFSNVYSSRLKKTDEEVAVKIIKVRV